MARRPKRKAITLVCLFIGVFAAMQCSRETDRTGIEASTITILYPTDERALGPIHDMPAKFLVFLPLVTYGKNGKLERRLAESWEHSPDYRTWIIHLRKDVRWHDGVPVTAHDIKFTLDLYAHPNVGYGSYREFSVTVLDDHTFKIIRKGKFLKPIPELDPYAVYYPKHLLEDLDPYQFWNWEFWTQPIGNGPYRYVRHIPKMMVELKANPLYYREKPRIERLILKFGGSAPVTELLSGNVDVLAASEGMDIPKIVNDPRFRVYHNIWPDLSYLGVIFWNKRSQLLDEPSVRRALTLAINRRELHRLFNFPKNIPIFDVIFTWRQFWRGELLKPLPYDPELAKELLDKAGWRAKNSDGIRTRSGIKFRFVAIVPGDGMERAAVYVQEQFRRIGVRMEVQTLEQNLVREKLRNNDYVAAFSTFPNWEGNGGLIKWFRQDSWLSYRNPKVAQLLNTANETGDPAEYDRIYSKLMPLLQEDMPITFLFPSVNTSVAHQRVRGLSNDLQFDLILNIENLWIEEENY
ncbi:MAG: ABC transporter substrate-binding protein [Candidatus Aminicenantes bacterium]